MFDFLRIDTGLEAVAVIIMLSVIILFFAVIIILFRHYLKYYKKCAVNGLIDDEIKNTLIDENKAYFKHKDKKTSEEDSKRPQLFSQYLAHKEEKKRRRKWLSIVGEAVSVLAVVTVIVFLIFAESGNKLLFVGGKSSVVVLTDSMQTVEPSNTYIEANELNDQIHHHSLIFLNEVHGEDDVKLYDIVVYKDDEGRNIVHRVIEIVIEDGKTFYTCRGDANNATADYERKMEFECILGKYTGSQSFFLGVLITFLRSTIGIIAIAAAFITICLFERYDKKINAIISTRKPEIIALIDAELCRGEPLDFK